VSNVKKRCDGTVIRILNLIDSEVAKPQALSKAKKGVPLRAVMDAAGVDGTLLARQGNCGAAALGARGQGSARHHGRLLPSLRPDRRSGRPGAAQVRRAGHLMPTRPMQQSDRGFVLDALLHTSHRLPVQRLRSEDVHQRGYGSIICSLIDRDRVLVACDDVDPDVLHGFIAFDPAERVVDYLYVKKGMRGFGVAKQLVTSHAQLGTQGTKDSAGTKTAVRRTALNQRHPCAPGRFEPSAFGSVDRKNMDSKHCNYQS
jgi:hypothetical protein